MVRREKLGTYAEHSPLISCNVQLKVVAFLGVYARIIAEGKQMMHNGVVINTFFYI